MRICTRARPIGELRYPYRNVVTPIALDKYSTDTCRYYPGVDGLDADAITQVREESALLDVDRRQRQHPVVVGSLIGRRHRNPPPQARRDPAPVSRRRPRSCRPRRTVQHLAS